MNILNDIYTKSLHENENAVKFWNDYLQNLNSLSFDAYSDKLTVPVLVPIGNRILFRGALKHTNEVTVALGADYFAKCSIKQAEVLRQHRIQDAKLKLEAYNKEKNYLENQLSFGKQSVNENAGQNIIEVCTEEEDKTWREQHRERLKQYHRSTDKKQERSNTDISDEDLMMRLEELELQEELENEMSDLNTEQDLDNTYKSNFDSCIIKEQDVGNIETEDQSLQQEPRITHNIPKQTSKIDLLQQVIDRQKMLESKLIELKTRERVHTKSESDLLSRLEEIEQLEDLEDEMDRLDDILEENDDEDSTRSDTSKSSKSVAFADENDSETLEVTFKHSDVEPNQSLYDPEQGILKPNDIYIAHSNLFTNGTTSILRKSKYIEDEVINKETSEVSVDVSRRSKKKEIVIKNVIEKTDPQVNIVASARPTSLFKKRRQQKS